MFFIMTRRQIRKTGFTGFGWAALGTLAFGLVIELLEGITGEGNCRMRDLVPDFVGVLIGQLVYFIWNYVSSKLPAKS